MHDQHVIDVITSNVLTSSFVIVRSSPETVTLPYTAVASS